MLNNRLAPLQYETIESYLDRLGQRNYYEERNWFISLLNLPRETHMNYLYSEDAFLKLSQLTLLDVKDLKNMTLQRFIPVFYNSSEIAKLPTERQNREPTPKWDEAGRSIYLNSTKKVCPLCILENNCKLLPWLIRPVTICPVHEIFLIDSCPICNRKINLVNGKCCYCGTAHFSTTSGKGIKRTDAEYGLFIWSAIGCIPDEKQKDYVQKGYPLNVLNSPEIFKFLWRMGNLLLDYDVSNPLFLKEETLEKYPDKRNSLREASVYYVHYAMLSAYNLLLDWPSNWYACLDRVLYNEKNDCIRNSRATKRHLFPYQLKKSFFGTNWKWLLESWLHFVQEQKNNQFITDWEAYSERIRNIHLKPCNVLNDQGNIFSPLVAINIPATQESREKDEYLNLEKASSFLGISKRCLTYLAENGYIKVGERNRWGNKIKWRFLKRELSAFLITIASKANEQNPSRENSEWLYFTKAIQSNSSFGMKVIDLVSAILNSQIPTFQFTNAQNLRDVWFFKKEIIALRENFTNGGGEVDLLTIYDLMALLRCGRQTIINLRNLNLIIPFENSESNDEKKWLYKKEDANIFQSKYITSKEAAVIIGISERMVTSWSKRGWLPTIVTPSNGSGHFYRYEKETIVEWRKERLSSQEAREFLGIKQRTMEDWIAKGIIKPIPNISQHPYWFLREEIEGFKKI